MLMELAEVVLYAMWKQANDEGRHLLVDKEAVADAMADIDGYDRHVHLTKVGPAELRVQFG